MRPLSLDVIFGTISVFVIMLVVPLLLSFDFFNPFRRAIADFQITDVYFSNILPNLDTPNETDIVVVNTGIMTSVGLKEIPSNDLAQFLLMVQDAQPTVIGIGRDFKLDSNDMTTEIYLAALSQYDNIIYSGRLNDYNAENDKFKSMEYFQVTDNKDNYAFMNLLKDKDKRYTTIRNFYPLAEVENSKQVYKSFGVRVAEKYNPDAVERFLKRKSDIETINFIGNAEKYNVIDFEEIESEDFDYRVFANKIVIIGSFDINSSSHELERVFYTPLNERTSGRSFPDMYEIFIHANIVSMLLTDEYYDTFPTWAGVLIAIFVCWINITIFDFVSRKFKIWFEILSVLIFLVESVLLVLLTIQLFHHQNIEINLTMTIIASAISVFTYEIYYDSIKPTIRSLYFMIRG